MQPAPLFILGHWRTGTTLLHELLALDERHACPNGYECFAPNHFLLTERWFRKWFGSLPPSRRPMDSMTVSLASPQEDEIALCLLGQPSPYLNFAFPNHLPQYRDYFDLESLPPRVREAWKKTFRGFLQQLYFQHRKRIILKSPLHSARIPALLELFPDARFVHIVRNPYVVFPSTVHMWKAMTRTYAMQKPAFRGLEEQVFSNFTRLYDCLEKGKALIAPVRFHELKYEDLVRDPVGKMQTLYAQLGLGEFDRVRSRLERRMADLAGYQTNRYELTRPLRSEISQRWGNVIRRYGYEEEAEPELGFACAQPQENATQHTD